MCTEDNVTHKDVAKILLISKRTAGRRLHELKAALNKKPYEKVTRQEILDFFKPKFYTLS